MWHIWLMCQSSNPEVVGLSPACGENLAVGQTFSGWIPPHPGDKLGTWRQCGLYKLVIVSCALVSFIIMTLYTPTGVDLIYTEVQ